MFYFCYSLSLRTTDFFKLYAYNKGDFEVWNTNIEEKKISDKAKVSLEEEFRFGDNANELFYQFYSGLGFKAFKNFDGGLYYMLQHTRTVGRTKTAWPFVNVLGVKFKINF